VESKLAFLVNHLIYDRFNLTINVSITDLIVSAYSQFDKSMYFYLNCTKKID